MIDEIRERLEAKVEALPQLPGVYLMRSDGQEVIYVGKAVNLRARVRSYLRGGDGRAQIEFLLRRLFDLEVIVTENENQAFILERDLIARYKPRYNIRLKDDRAYFSIRLDRRSPWPRLEVVRKIENDGAEYFGPYSSGYDMRNLLEVIKRTVPLRTCSNTVFYNRTRPCLEYQIKRCAGPCCLEVDADQYQDWISQAVAILEGKSDGVKRSLTVAMERAAEELRFEDAAELRDRIDALTSAKESAPFVTPGLESRDAFALFREEQLAAVAVLIVRSGRIIDSVQYTFEDIRIDDGDLIEAVISQFYEQGREIPDEILCSQEPSNSELLTHVLTTKAARSVTVIVPQRGLKARFMGLAELNAQQHFVATFNAEQRYQEIARALATRCSLKQIPRRIEVIDISNFQGSDIVGALVCFTDGEPDKSAYRKYKISQQGKPDDFASIHEVVSRRLRRGAAEGDLPDLLIIDGGPPQLRSAHAARDELGLSLEIISLAKERELKRARLPKKEIRPERLYTNPEGVAIELATDDPLTHFVARMRDEVHRFVITFHRKTRSKRVFRSQLDEIAGLGPEKRTRLLAHFGSTAAIARADIEEVARVGRMPKTLAEKTIARLRKPEST
jgi:excinuclease ABC subunit C